MPASNFIPALTTLFYLVASGIFLTQTIAQVRRNEAGVSRSFNLLMTVFMSAWSVTELLEDTFQPPFSLFWEYAHFVVMVSFAVAITRRWKWTERAASRPLEAPTSREKAV